MRLTIIPADRSVAIDGEHRSPLEFTIDPTIHAVQWYGDRGEVEFVSTPEGKPPNQTITSISQFQSAIDAFNAWQPGPIPEPEPTPTTQVSMRQARLMLYNMGLLEQVQAMISLAPVPVQIEWEYATVVERSSALVTEIGAQLGLTDDQIDRMFEDARLL